MLLQLDGDADGTLSLDEVLACVVGEHAASPEPDAACVAATGAAVVLQARLRGLTQRPPLRFAIYIFRSCFEIGSDGLG